MNDKKAVESHPSALEATPQCSNAPSTTLATLYYKHTKQLASQLSHISTHYSFS